jgi:two-component system, cell cycle sensor histidine kinase and response regulator CckA
MSDTTPASSDGDESPYRRLVEHSLGFMCVHDLAGVFVYVSPPAAHALGRTPEDMTGRSLRGYLAPAVEELFDAYLDRIRRNRADSGLMLLQAKDGAEQIWEYRNVLLDVPGSEPRVYGHAIDVTERMRAEQDLRRARRELEESQARHQSLVEGSGLGVCIHQDGVIRFANGTFARMHGHEGPQDLIGQPFVTLLAPEAQDRGRAEIVARLSGERLPDNQEVEHVARDGRILWVETWSSVVLWNRALAVLVTVIDVTERKRLEGRMRQMDKVEAVARLAGGVAHECNNLMAVVVDRGELLQDSLEPVDPRRGSVEILVQTAGRVARLAEHLLAFSRRLTLRLEVVDLGELIGGLAPRLREVVPPTVAIKCIAPGEVWAVEADRAQVEEALIRLGTNAADAMAGDGLLLVEAANVELDDVFVKQHAGARPGPYVAVTVRDTGAGMSDEVQAHLFEPFFTTKGAGGGTGLGLPSVYGIVKQHGGYIEVESAPGAGTAVRLYFPRAGHETAAPSPAP